jgi:hypothetical protein
MCVCFAWALFAFAEKFFAQSFDLIVVSKLRLNALGQISRWKKSAF